MGESGPVSQGQDGRSGTGRFRPGGRRGFVVAAAVVVLAAAGVGGVWASTGMWPLAKDRYCWGSWEQNSGPSLLGDGKVEDPGSKRTAEQTAAPSAERPHGTCTLRVTTSSSEDDDESDYSYESAESDTTETEEPVTVEYGPVPRGREARLEWLAEYLDGSVAPLPDGVPGLVSREKGMVVLPRECDVDGRPSTVTITGDEVTGGDTEPGETTSIGGEGEVAELLLAVANRQMRQVGCAPDKPMRVTSPVAAPGDAAPLMPGGMSPACRIPGLDFSVGKRSDYKAAAGAVTDDVQLCKVTDYDDVRDPQFAGQFVMVAQPRLAALFHGFVGEEPPGDGWRGNGTLTDAYSAVEAGCGRGSKAVFLLQFDGYSLRQVADPDPERIFARAVNSVADRIGCPDVAPKQ